MTILAWLFGILVGPASDNWLMMLWSLLARLTTVSLLFAVAAGMPGCSAPSSTPISTVSGPTIVTRDGASPAPSTAPRSPQHEYATGSVTYQPALSPSPLPLIMSLSPIDWIVFTVLFGGSGAVSGGVAASKVASRVLKSNGL